MKSKLFFSVSFLLIVLLCSFIVSPNLYSIKPKDRIYFELPEIHSGDQIIKHTAYTLKYSKEHEQAEWTAYMLTKMMTRAKFPRTNKFKIDPNVETGSSSPKDYKNTGYNKGHLVPCDDMRWSKVSESESFYMSNMTPQTHSFNAGIWKKLESWVHKYAYIYDTVYVTAGPILQKGLKTIGANEVSVPKYFYKALLVYKQNEKKCIGFIFLHKQSKKEIMAFSVPVDSIENQTGINLFASVPDSIQKRIESIVDISQWKIKK